MTSKAKSFDLMVSYLMIANDKVFMSKQSDYTDFTEKCLLKGYQIVGKQQYFAKNLSPAEVL